MPRKKTLIALSALLAAIAGGVVVWTRIESRTAPAVYRLISRRALHGQELSAFRAACLGDRVLPKPAGSSSARIQIQARSDADSDSSTDEQVVCERFIEGPAPSEDELRSSSTSTHGLELWTLVGPCDDAQAKAWVVWNEYYPKPGREAEVEAWRTHACDVRETLKRPRGCVWRRLQGPADRPQVMWSLAVPSPSPEILDLEAKMSETEEFQAVMAHMRTLIDRFEMDLWQVEARPGQRSPQGARPRVQRFVKDAWINEPNGWWERQEFAELVPPIRLPTVESWNDHITVWMKMPPGKKIDWAASGPEATEGLRYPPGTILDRVEYAGIEVEPGREVMTVIDVRGTRLDGRRREIFHVYRPENQKPHAKLRGFEWPRGHAEAQEEATTRLIDFLETAPTAHPGRSKAEFLDGIRVYNQCAPCHAHDKALSKIERPGEMMPRSATDSQGFYSVLRVLSDENAPETNRSYDLNADDRFVEVRCGKDKAKLEVSGTERRYVCPDKQVPLGRRDIERGLREKDPYTQSVCAARRYLFEHMTDEARAQFKTVFEVCGIGTKS